MLYKYKSKNLYVVRPSKIVFFDVKNSWRDYLYKSDACFPTTRTESKEMAKEGIFIPPTSIINNTKYKIYNNKYKKTLEQNNTVKTHIADFINIPEDTTVAFHIGGNLYESISDEKCIYSGIMGDRHENDMCIDVYDNDKILLAKYLWDKKTREAIFNKEIERYILNLKPFIPIVKL